MSNLTVFQFESQEVRFVGTSDDPWWIAADVCAVLEIKNVGNVIAKLDDDEKRDDIQIMDVIGRSQAVWCINESGLYSLILTSRKPQAKRFKKWVTSEVLPSIHKTGSYAIANPPATETIETLRLSEERAKFTFDFAREVLRETKLSTELQIIYATRAMEAHLPESAQIAKVIVGAVQETTATSDRHMTPSELGELFSTQNGLPKPVKASNINIALESAGLQWKEIITKTDKRTGKDRKINVWHLTELGKQWGVVVQDKARGHDKTIEHVRWLSTVLGVISLEGAS